MKRQQKSRVKKARQRFIGLVYDFVNRCYDINRLKQFRVFYGKQKYVLPLPKGVEIVKAK